MAKLSTDRDKQAWVHYQAALKVASLLTKAGFDAYLIGGAVRDILSGHLPKDFDLVTNATPEQILALKGLKAAHYKDPAQAFGVTRVKIDIPTSRGVLPGEPGYKTETGKVEVATYRRDIEAHLGRKQTKVEFAELEDDVKRRDFTVNALALDIANDFLIDLVGGIADIEQGLVRFIGDPAQRLQEDPLRLLRGIRLKVQYGFSFAKATEEAITQAVRNGLVEQIAVERLRDELSRMLRSSRRRLAIEELDKFGIIERVLPELNATKGVAQPPEFHIEGDVWAHSLMAIDNLPGEVSLRLAWATLLHDIGKPPTFAPKSATHDRIRFSGHYAVGAELSQKVLERLQFSKAVTRDVEWMIAKHIGIDDLPKMRAGRALHLMAHPAFNDLLTLHEADAAASWHLLPSGHVEVPHPDFREIRDLYARFKDRAQSVPTLKDIGVDGRWLEREFKLEEGPRLGEILQKLEDAYLDGKIKDQAAAKALVEKLLSAS